MFTRSIGLRRAAVCCAAVVALLVTGSTPASAGPPLLCHPFEISGAPSLPWDGRTSWFDGEDSYDLSRLVRDTEALLTPSTPVIVRMETLRRAAIYASQDARVAGSLIEALTARVLNAQKRGTPDALAYLDAAYAIESLRQIGRLNSKGDFEGRAEKARSVVANLDGYSLVKKAIALRPDDPALAFAAALFAADRDQEAYTAHAKIARAGAGRDALLARNIRQVQ